MASRLSFFLWESVPDDALLQAAARGRARDRRRSFTRRRSACWPTIARAACSGAFPASGSGSTGSSSTSTRVRTPEVDPRWTAATQTSAFTETQLFVENILAHGGTLRDLMTSWRAWVNGEMARVYGVAAPADPRAWTRGRRSRGRARGAPDPRRVPRRLLASRRHFATRARQRDPAPPALPAPDLAAAGRRPLAADAPAGRGPADQPHAVRGADGARRRARACHAGSTASGSASRTTPRRAHYQTTDNGLPVDASGTINGTDVDGPFDGALALSRGARLRARSSTMRDAASSVRYALGRAPADVERRCVDALAEELPRERRRSARPPHRHHHLTEFPLRLVERRTDVRLRAPAAAQGARARRGSRASFARASRVARAGRHRDVPVARSSTTSAARPHPEGLEDADPGRADATQFAERVAPRRSRRAEFSPTLAPLYPYRDRLLAIEGLCAHVGAGRHRRGDAAGSGDLNNHQVGVADVLTGARALQRAGHVLHRAARATHRPGARRCATPPGALRVARLRLRLHPELDRLAVFVPRPGQATPMVSDPRGRLRRSTRLRARRPADPDERAPICSHSMRPSVLDTVAREYDFLAPRLDADGRQKLERIATWSASSRPASGAIGPRRRRATRRSTPRRDERRATPYGSS